MVILCGVAVFSDSSLMIIISDSWCATYHVRAIPGLYHELVNLSP